MFKYYMGWKYLNDSTPSEIGISLIVGVFLIVCVAYYTVKSTK